MGSAAVTRKCLAATLAAATAVVCIPAGALAQITVVEYYHTDAIGNVRAVTNQAQQVVERHDYLPYGEEWCPGPPAGVCGSVTPGQAKRFTGKERDPETGLDYFGARYYGSRIGRFTTVDPYLDTSAALLNPQRWNRYSYGLNNPLRNVDPDGRDAWDIVTGAANAFGSNFSLGLGRQSGNSDFAKGQFVGDLVSIPAGYAWGDAGAGIAAVGVVGAPESGGVTLVASAAGVGMMVQGGTASLAGLANAGIYLANNTREGMGFTRGGKKRIDQANADKYGGKNVCENCGAETVPGKRHEKGVSPPGSERQRDHIEPRSKGGKGIPDNGQVLCRECNIDKSNH